MATSDGDPSRCGELDAGDQIPGTFDSERRAFDRKLRSEKTREVVTTMLDSTLQKKTFLYNSFYMSTRVSHIWIAAPDHSPLLVAKARSNLRTCRNLNKCSPLISPSIGIFFSTEGQEYKDQIHSIFLKQGITDGIKTAVVVRQGSACVAL